MPGDGSRAPRRRRPRRPRRPRASAPSRRPLASPAAPALSAGEGAAPRPASAVLATRASPARAAALPSISPGVGPRSVRTHPVLRRDAVGAFEARLRSAARVRRIIPGRARRARPAAGGGSCLRRRIDPDHRARTLGGARARRARRCRQPRPRGAPASRTRLERVPRLRARRGRSRARAGAPRERARGRSRGSPRQRGASKVERERLARGNRWLGGRARARRGAAAGARGRGPTRSTSRPRRSRVPRRTRSRPFEASSADGPGCPRAPARSRTPCRRARAALALLAAAEWPTPRTRPRVGRARRALLDARAGTRSPRAGVAKVTAIARGAPSSCARGTCLARAQAALGRRRRGEHDVDRLLAANGKHEGGARLRDALSRRCPPRGRWSPEFATPTAGSRLERKTLPQRKPVRPARGTGGVTPDRRGPTLDGRAEVPTATIVPPPLLSPGLVRRRRAPSGGRGDRLAPAALPDPAPASARPSGPARSPLASHGTGHRSRGPAAPTIRPRRVAPARGSRVARGCSWPGARWWPCSVSASRSSRSATSATSSSSSSGTGAGGALGDPLPLGGGDRRVRPEAPTPGRGLHRLLRVRRGGLHPGEDRELPRARLPAGPARDRGRLRWLHRSHGRARADGGRRRASPCTTLAARREGRRSRGSSPTRRATSRPHRRERDARAGRRPRARAPLPRSLRRRSGRAAAALQSGPRRVRGEPLLEVRDAPQVLRGQARSRARRERRPYAIRRVLFSPIRPDTIIDDFVIPVRIAVRGWRSRLSPTPSRTRRPPRTPAASSCGAPASARRLASARARPGPARSAHRLRLLLVRLAQAAALDDAVPPRRRARRSLPLAAQPGAWLYRALLLAQLLFYGLALAGPRAAGRLRRGVSLAADTSSR